MYFLLGLPVVWRAFPVLVALRRPHILRSIGTFQSLLEHMSYLLCSMGLRCHGLLRIGQLRFMLAWHVGMVGVVAFVGLCAKIALMPRVHIPTLKRVLSFACSPNQCPFQDIFCLPNLLRTCSWY